MFVFYYRSMPLHLFKSHILYWCTVNLVEDFHRVESVYTNELAPECFT